MTRDGLSGPKTSVALSIPRWLRCDAAARGAVGESVPGQDSSRGVVARSVVGPVHIDHDLAYVGTVDQPFVGQGCVLEPDQGVHHRA